MRTLDDIGWRNKAALVRADLNVPIVDGQITDATRIEASLPTLTKLLTQGVAVTVLSHLGRPNPVQPDPALSLAPVATKLGQLLNQPVPLVALDDSKRPAPGTIQLLENTRFNVGEKENNTELAKRYASCGNVFVMDAFASSHRAEASTVALAYELPECCAGQLMQAECFALEKAMSEPKRPLLAIIGGAKVSTKLAMLENLAMLADQIVVGGGIANTFIASQGYQVGKSLYEPDLLNMCSELQKSTTDKFIIPVDVVVAPNINAPEGTIKKIDQIGADELILDVGPDSSKAISEVIAQAKTVIWNGALGVFEYTPFSKATCTLAENLGQSAAFTLAGGGETVAAINQYKIADKISYLSTGGGAFLQFIEGKKMPGLNALQ